MRKTGSQLLLSEALELGYERLRHHRGGLSFVEIALVGVGEDPSELRQAFVFKHFPLLDHDSSINRREERCPSCGAVDTRWTVLRHLEVVHRWSLEQLIKQVERLETFDEEKL